MKLQNRALAASVSIKEQSRVHRPSTGAFVCIAVSRDASTASRSHQLRPIDRPASIFFVGSYTWKARK